MAFTEGVKVRAIAFYLPQFYPIPENDDSWGTGFTEWTNVAKAKPLFSGHWQPRLPADLGFYDLRVPEVREQQATLAQQARIEAFCYWHYWFGDGRRVLERPFQEVLDSGKPDFPFCLAWANQSWTGIWHGMPRSTMIKQSYPGPSDVVAHFQALLPAFKDPRYFRVDGKPLFAVYDPNHLCDTSAFVGQWRGLAEKAGLPGIFMVGMSNVHRPKLLEPFDMLTTFGPGDFLDQLPRTFMGRVVARLKRTDAKPDLNRWLGWLVQKPYRFRYEVVANTIMIAKRDDPRYVPCVLSNWDNTPRSASRGYVFEDSTPELYQRWLRHAVEAVADRPIESRIVFIKAWNEWAEGNYLEPDARFGRAYLNATRQALQNDS